MVCDREGVPVLVQHMSYWYSNMSFDITFFNGKTKRFLSEHLTDCVGLLQNAPTRMQWLQIENAINVLALEWWADWFPNHG